MEKHGAYYDVTAEEYVKIIEDAYVVFHWDGSQLDFDPTQFGAKKIDIISNE
ncbi:hypothetical protein [Sporosarcina sp. P13]|uniref:hypothetical protein n=1 Tax=Sporosarcina sp. P13 TaxID=2048263 RepID=UPI0013044807|nr:hypothetical protein [Sporosarcina sp. P13]